MQDHGFLLLFSYVYLQPKAILVECVFSSRDVIVWHDNNPFYLHKEMRICCLLPRKCTATTTIHEDDDRHCHVMCVLHCLAFFKSLHSARLGYDRPEFFIQCYSIFYCAEYPKRKCVFTVCSFAWIGYV